MSAAPTVDIGEDVDELVTAIDAYRTSRETRAGRRTTWQAHAACHGTDPAVFYPGRGESGAAAREICARCPVRTDCLIHALALYEKVGIWGGVSERQRRRMRATIARARRSAA